MAIHDDTVKSIEAETCVEPFDLPELTRLVPILEQRCQEFDQSSIIEQQQQPQQQKQHGSDQTRLQYPTTPKMFNTFNHLKKLKHDGYVLISEMWSHYWDHVIVIAEMADAFQVFF